MEDKHYEASDFGFYLNWKCMQCGAKYGTEPNYCHGCRSNNLVQIEPEFESLLRSGLRK